MARDRTQCVNYLKPIHCSSHSECKKYINVFSKQVKTVCTFYSLCSGSKLDREMECVLFNFYFYTQNRFEAV